ncbi:flagellar basal body rod protein FlgB [bacterium]|nr:flagellar basal body rod protein FlgB [bacterium]
MSTLFDTSVRSLEKSMDLFMVRHNVIADNIANAETPYYKAREVSFENELQRAVSSEEAGMAGLSIEGVRPSITQDLESEMGQDLNSVDMDREMAKMTKNDVQYSAASQMISKKFALLKYAISGGSER